MPSADYAGTQMKTVVAFKHMQVLSESGVRV